MAVDVETSVEINCGRTQVAAFAVDPGNAIRWYVNIKTVRWVTPPPLAVGSQIAFAAQFLGRRLTYTYRVLEWTPGERFVMSTAEGPFPMTTTYSWQDLPTGGTRMVLRNQGEPSGFSRIAAPAMARAMSKANHKDLVRLKALLEGGNA